MKKVLTIEEMKHLEELGLDTSDASMYAGQIQCGNEWLDTVQSHNDYTLYPAYTLQDIMRKITNWSNHLLISFVYFGEGVACILSTENDNILHSCSSSVYKNETDIDASYQMLL